MEKINPNAISGEEWRAIPGYSEYAVSNLGRVLSPSGKVLKTDRSKSARGYFMVTLKGDDGQWAQVAIHRAVAWAFIGPQPIGMHAAHNNGDRYDNRLSNLRYVTPKENTADMIAHGRHKIPKSRIIMTETRNEAIRQVAAMLKEREKQETIETIARRIGVSRVTLYRLAWAYNEKGGTAETVTAPEQPTENADGGSLPQSGKAGKQL